MIHISTRRAGPLVLAATVHDDLYVSQTWGLTVRGAERRLSRLLDRKYR